MSILFFVSFYFSISATTQTLFLFFYNSYYFLVSVLLYSRYVKVNNLYLRYRLFEKEKKIYCLFEYERRKSKGKIKKTKIFFIFFLDFYNCKKEIGK